MQQNAGEHDGRCRQGLHKVAWCRRGISNATCSHACGASAGVQETSRGAPPALRHPRKVSRSSAQARRKANALERALRMLCEKRPDLEISIPGRRRPPSSQVQVCSAVQVQCM